MTSCRGTVAKLVLVAVNMVCILLGLVAILMGYRMHESGPTGVSSPNELILDLVSWRTLYLTLIITGVAVCLVATFGVSAALCDASTMLNLYVYLLAVFCAAVVVGNVCFWLFSGTIFGKASKYFRQLVMNSSQDTDALNMVQVVQSFAYCCGKDSFLDWHNQTWTNQSDAHGLDSIPTSCCAMKWWSGDTESGNQTMVSTSTENTLCDDTKVVYMDGCFSPVQVKRYMYFGQDLFLLVLFFLVILLALSCCLERDRRIEASKLINLQYAAHLHICRGQDVTW